MKRLWPLIVLSLVVALDPFGAHAALAQTIPNLGKPQGWPDQHPVLSPSASAGERRPISAPGLKEPFAIGEALHDPHRVEVAVRSMLAAMGIETVPDAAAFPPGRARLRLTECEARTLIDWGTSDAEAQSQDAGRYTFANLHHVLAPSMNAVAADRLAEIYADQYQRRGDEVVPQMLLGQPVAPDTPFMRTELWMLLADGVLPPQPRGAAGFLVQNGYRSLDERRWSTDAWAELQLRLPLLVPCTVVLTRGVRGHEGHGGPGQTFFVDARVSAKPIRLNAGGELPVRQESPAGLPLTWESADNIRAHALNLQPTTRTTIAANGVARLAITPKPETANGCGQFASETGPASVTIPLGQLLTAAYDVPPSFVWFDAGATAKADVTIEWHLGCAGATTTTRQPPRNETLEITVTNVYDVGSNAAAFALTRTGVDSAKGTLTLQQDGTYRGTVTLVAGSRIRLPGATCAPYGLAWQQAEVVATPIARDRTAIGQNESAFYNGVHRPADYSWLRGQPAAYVRLEFSPSTDPEYGPSDPCQSEIPPHQTASGRMFIPLNDAQWTIAGFGSVGGVDTVNPAGYAIALPDAGLLRYEDHTSDNSAQNPLLRVGGVDLSGLMKVNSVWYVSVSRTRMN